MCCKNFWKRIVPFALTLLLGFLAVNILQKVNFTNKQQVIVKPVSEKAHFGEGNGIGCSECGRQTVERETALENSSTESKNMQIVSKARANYTDAARQNNTEGIVTLRVTFLANGEIGNISVVNALPNGLTEQAVAAAKQIRFNPAIRNGVPVAVTKQVQYSFIIY